ncbi:MAG: Xaa-Pro peptidase family protein [Treponema sp.]|jgi:Xaa-Pro aminopeptidase|nr:Xaa-Pro peptidase family protein [Treponema sp.]
MELSLSELIERRARFAALMERSFPDWDTAIIMDNTNQYYFTGTMQDGILLIYKDGSCLYGIRRSFSRGKEESPLPDREIVPIATYRDLAAIRGPRLGNVYIEGDTMPVITLERLKKYFEMASVNYLDAPLRVLRSVKSPYELEWIRRSGKKHQELLEERVPGLLREGMSEAEFMGELIAAMHRLGYHGLSRFHQFQTEMIVGQIGFGTNSLYPTRFDGPDGARGNGPAAPFAGDSSRRLARGDLVFVDIGFGIGGYHSDKTQVYLFGQKVPEALEREQRRCIDIQKRLAGQLRPGALPSRIYEDLLASIPPDQLQYFMGVDPGHRVKFLGHGVGLQVDELPVIARGFDAPLEENMVIALEPKQGAPGIGMVGVEDTYIVQKDGGLCVTGGGRDIMVV